MTKPRTIFGVHVPFFELIGAREEHWGDGRAVVSLQLSKDVLNSWGVAHGGVVSTILDTAMGGAALTAVGPASGVVTVSLSVNFIRSGAGALVAEARVTRSGRSIVFCEGEVRDREGEVVARGMGTFKVRRREERDPIAPRGEAP